MLRASTAFPLMGADWRKGNGSNVRTEATSDPLCESSRLKGSVVNLLARQDLGKSLDELIGLGL